MLYPSSGISEREAEKMLPEEVSLHVTRIPMRDPTQESLLHMADSLEEASKLLAHARVDIIAFNCTAGSLLKGKGYDQEIIARINRATSLPATTTTTAIIAGLRVLGINRLILISPYSESVHQEERSFLEEMGFQVVNERCLSLSDCIEQYETGELRWYEVAKTLKDPRSDGYFISCGGIRVVDIIQRLETDLNKPVVTSNQALVWHCLGMIGFQGPIKGFGRLFENSLDP